MQCSKLQHFIIEFICCGCVTAIKFIASWCNFPIRQSHFLLFWQTQDLILWRCSPSNRVPFEYCCVSIPASRADLGFKVRGCATDWKVESGVCGVCVCKYIYDYYSIYIYTFQILYISNTIFYYNIVFQAHLYNIVIKQGKSEGFDSCDRPSNLIQIGFKSSIFCPCDFEIWWMTTKNNKARLLYNIKPCVSFHIHQWIQTGVTVQKRPIWVKLDDFFSCVTLEFDIWPWKTKGHLFYATSSFVHHFVAIGKFKLELQSGNGQFGSKSTIFLAVWPCNLTYDLEQQ